MPELRRACISAAAWKISKMIKKCMFLHSRQGFLMSLAKHIQFNDSALSDKDFGICIQLCNRLSPRKSLEISFPKITNVREGPCLCSYHGQWDYTLDLGSQCVTGPYHHKIREVTLSPDALMIPRDRQTCDPDRFLVAAIWLLSVFTWWVDVL